MKTFIIGGGIAGLVAAYYIKDAHVFSEDLGGQMANPGFTLGPRILEETPQSSVFMEELELYKPYSESPGLYKSGYFYKNKLHKDLNQERREAYMLKTRGELVGHEVGNKGRSELRGWTITPSLVEVLTSKVKDRIIHKRVTSINTEAKTLKVDDNLINYDRVISTVPLKTLINMVWPIKDPIPEMRFYAKHIYGFRGTHPVIEHFPNYEFIYLLDKEEPFYRVTRTFDGCTLESNQDIDQGLWPINVLIGKKVLTPGQVINDLNLKEWQGIHLLGRFAQWSHEIRTAEVIKRVVEELL